MASTAAPDAAAATAPPARIPSTDEAWKAAKKLRSSILSELQHAGSAGPDADETARFEKVEGLMENYRLACIETIWPDMRAAKEKGVEDALWQTHAHVTKAYRKVLGMQQGHSHAVLRRKLEKRYLAYLRTAQYFYKGYLQRVCARYDMPDLRRIARLADLDEMTVPDTEKVDPAAAQLEDVVRASCHKTLIYLGDLARYRTLLRAKDRRWDIALAYYSLANDLMPESGYGHHQSGVIYVETDDHLQIVYHLYRALACDIPHPNASTNLEREFRDLRKRRSTGIKHALVGWFVKLHAFYYQGKEFAERQELEDEVDHRLTVAMKMGQGLDSDEDLLKIILINICAYIAARERTRAKWTEEGSRSCQFILLRNIRTILAISRVLGDETADLIQHGSAENPSDKSDSAAQPEGSSKFTPAFTRVLPLLRVYMAWLCSTGSDLVEFRAHLEPHFGAMCTALSKTLTRLFELVMGDPKLGKLACWRFPEDDMTLGIKPLNGPDLNAGCRLYYDPLTRQPKPRREDVPGADNAAGDVTFTRAIDAIFCGLELADAKSKFPFATSTAQGTRPLTVFTYLENGKPEPPPSLPVVQTPASVDAGATVAVRPAAPAPFEQGPDVESEGLSEYEDFYGPSLRRARRDTGRAQAAATTAATTQPTRPTEFPIERQLFRILNDFLSPPEAAPTTEAEPHGSPAGYMSSYAMSSVAAPEPPAAALSASPVPGSPKAKPFPTLPWNYFYSPVPVRSTMRNSGMGGTPTWSADSPGSTRLANQPLQGQNIRGAWLGAAGNGHSNNDSRAATAAAAASPRQQQHFRRPSASPWETGQSHYHPATFTNSHMANSPFSNLDFSSNASSLPPVNSPWGLPAAAQQRFASPRGGGSSAAAPELPPFSH